MRRKTELLVTKLGENLPELVQFARVTAKILTISTKIHAITVGET